MKTRWDADEVAAGFDAYDDLPERVIGYPGVYQALRLGAADAGHVLDYGCGPGKVALRIARQYGARVTAVDTSPAMIARATATRTDPRISYHLLAGAALPFLPGESIDAAMSCYVFINIGSIDQIRSIVAEVYRVLRPSGRYAILDTNPDTTGVQFSTFRSGDPGRDYSEGEQRTVLLTQPDGGQLELLDYHWPRSTYQSILRSAGFREIAVHQPVLTDATNALDGVPGAGRLVAERVQAPFVIIAGEK